MHPRLRLARIALLACSAAACTTSEPSPRDVATPPDATPATAVYQPVLTQHNDAARTGANLAESCLAPENVAELAELRRFHIDGQLYAQPLIAPATGTDGAGHTLLVLASTANEVAAFDLAAVTDAPLWQVGPDVLGTPGVVIRNVAGPLGILSTPAIDPTGDRLFVVARACPTASALSGCHHTLAALRLSTGALIDQVEIKASFTTPAGTSEAFAPDAQWNRPGLLLQAGQLYVAWAAGQSGDQHEEDFVYHGWVMAFAADDLHAAPRVDVTTPHGRAGGIWQAGAGLAGDGGAVFATTGNAVLDTVATTPSDFPAAPIDEENSVIRLAFAPDGSIQRARYFDDRPYHADGNVFQYMDRWDIDVSSAGPALIPASDDLIVGAKSGILYLLDQTTLAAVHAPLSVFSVPPLEAGQSLYIYSYEDGPQVLGAPVVWHADAMGERSSIYLWPRFDKLTRLEHRRAAHALELSAQSSDLAKASGAMLSLSANGAEHGLVWAAMARDDAEGGGPGEVRAYDATNLTQLWSAPLTGYAKFVCPTVSGGRLFAASWDGPGQGSDVVVFGRAGCP